MTPNRDEPLFIMPEKPRTIGPNEHAVRTMIDARIAAGIIDPDLWAAEIAAAITEARDVDQSQGIGRPSGRAALYGSYHDALDKLPRPETITSTDRLTQVLEVITAEAS